jgi:hypothetical protein
MQLFRIRAAALVLAAAIAAPGLACAQSASVLSCRLSVDDGEPANPPSTLVVRVASNEYEDFRDGAWGRNLCGSHGGGEAPDVQCMIRDGHFQADWTWNSNIGRLERHVLLNLATGELTDSDHNGLEKKGVCRPASDPSATATTTKTP